jgi:hypothetical protein
MHLMRWMIAATLSGDTVGGKREMRGGLMMERRGRSGRGVIMPVGSHAITSRTRERTWMNMGGRRGGVGGEGWMQGGGEEGGGEGGRG